MSEWVTVGKTGDVDDGGMVSFSVKDRQIAVANVGGDLHGFDDLCSHEQCSLAEGELDATIVECPCHGSQFDIITGEAVRGPTADPIDVFQVREEDGELRVFVG